VSKITDIHEGRRCIVACVTCGAMDSVDFVSRTLATYEFEKRGWRYQHKGWRCPKHTIKKSKSHDVKGYLLRKEVGL